MVKNPTYSGNERLLFPPGHRLVSSLSWFSSQFNVLYASAIGPCPSYWQRTPIFATRVPTKIMHQVLFLASHYTYWPSQSNQLIQIENNGCRNISGARTLGSEFEPARGRNVSMLCFLAYLHPLNEHVGLWDHHILCVRMRACVCVYTNKQLNLLAGSIKLDMNITATGNILMPYLLISNGQ